MTLQDKKVIAVRTGKTIYKHEGKVYKTFEKNYKKSDILNEALNHARVEESGIAVPTLYEVNCYDGKWTIVYQEIEGKTLEQLMNEHPENMDEYMDLFLNLQLEIHDHNLPHLNKIKDKLMVKIAACDLDATVRYELHTVLAGMPTHEHVLHGDFNPSNIVISSKDSRPYVIDWSHAAQGNSSYDAAMTYLEFILQDKQDLAERYLDAYVAKTETPKTYVQRWIPLVAASQLAVANPTQAEYLRKALNIYDHE